ncbi:MAG: response regulator [Treponemataceae bacterium]
MDARKKILIVDDEQINLEFFDVMLSKLGFIVEKAENGIDALEKTKKFVPDLIILDNIMPKMSGWEVTKTLKSTEEYREYRDIPIIMFSAMDDVKDKVEGFELGIDDYITKPYNFSEVLARIRAVTRNRELFAQIAARETRLNLVEELNAEFSRVGFLVTEEMDALITAARVPIDAPGAKKLAETVVLKAESVKKQLHELERRFQSTATERERLKKKEIELKTLEKQFRRGLQQD